MSSSCGWGTVVGGTGSGGKLSSRSSANSLVTLLAELEGLVVVVVLAAGVGIELEGLVVVVGITEGVGIGGIRGGVSEAFLCFRTEDCICMSVRLC